MKLSIYQDDAKEWRWRIRARNGKILAEGGEGYKNKKDCFKALSLLSKVPKLWAMFKT